MKIFVTITVSVLVSLVCVAAALLAYDFLIFRANRRATLAAENQGEGLDELDNILLAKEYFNNILDKKEFAINRFVIDEKIYNEKINSSRITRIALSASDIRALLNSQDEFVLLEITKTPEPYISQNKEGRKRTIEILEKNGLMSQTMTLGLEIGEDGNKDYLINTDIFTIKLIRNQEAEELGFGVSNPISVKNNDYAPFPYYFRHGEICYYSEKFEGEAENFVVRSVRNTPIKFLERFTRDEAERVKESQANLSNFLGYEYKITVPVATRMTKDTEDSYLETEKRYLI